MMQLAIIIALLWNNCVEGQSVNHDLQPMNTVALLKSKVVLSCFQDHDREIVWNFYEVRKTGDFGGTLLSNRGKILPELSGTFQLNRSLPGQYDLVIRSVNLGNAGIYECTKRSTNQPSAHLTVLQDRVCGVRNANGGIVSAHNGDTIHLSCTIQLTGHCQPAVDWTFDDGTFIGRSLSNDTNFESRTSISMYDYTVNTNKESVGFIATISFYCPGKDLRFNNLSSTFPEYKPVWKSPNIKILDSFANERYSLTTAIPTASHPVSNTNVLIIYMNVLLVVIVLMLVFGIIIRMVVQKHREKERVNGMTLSPYQGALQMSRPSEYYEIEIPGSIHSAGSVTVVNPEEETLPRAEETNTVGASIRIRSNGAGQDVERGVVCSNTVPISSNKHSSARLQTSTMPNKTQNKNYVELDASKKEDRSAPSVYKRLSNKKQQLVQSSQVPHTPEIEEEPHYCNVNRPRLPTPESNNSVESNMDQLAA